MVSHAQIEALLSLLEANTDIARGRVMGGALASQRVDEFWRNAAATLNSFGDGTSKAAPAWKTYWHELKYRARKRETDIRQHARGTGGGPGKKPLTITESRILQLLGQVSYAGNPEVQIPLSNLQNAASTAFLAATSTPSLSLSLSTGNLQTQSPIHNAGSAAVLPANTSPPLAQRTFEVPSPVCDPQNAGPYIPSPSPPSPQVVENPLSNLQNPTSPPPVSPPPVSPLAGSSEDSMAVGPRRGRTAALRNTRPYRRHRYDDPPVWARRYEEQRLRIDRDRARLLGRLVEIAEEALALYRTSMER